MPSFSSVNPVDKVSQDIAHYLKNKPISSDIAYQTAKYCFLDTLGCGFLALGFPECTKHLGPVVPGTIVPHFSRVPGTQWELDPIKAAWDIGCLIRWLDYNDTWLAAEWGHPSDNIGGILAITDFISRKNAPLGKPVFTIFDVLTAIIQAHEIQGVLALKNSYNQVGLDHVLLVRVATAGVVTQLLNGTEKQITDALSQAWADGGALRAYRHAPNAGSRKSWAAGDATSRGVFLALMTMKGEMGYPSILSTKKWGFYDTLFQGEKFTLERDFDSYVMENILFKISFPAEFHAQTAVEIAIRFYPQVKNKWEKIEKIKIHTHQAAMRIIVKTGKLNNPADRDHCLQYMVSCGLIFGNLSAQHYQDTHASHPLIDSLREKMEVEEEESYSKDYLDANKRSITNAMQIFFKDGTKTEKIVLEYPVGHKRRRKEGIPLLMEKFKENVSTRFPTYQTEKILQQIEDDEKWLKTPIHEWMDLLVL